MDVTLVTRQQKLKLYKVGICLRLAWDLSVSDFPTTWLQTKLQPLATSFLKKWSGLAKSADTSHLFLPKANGGLDLPELITPYKKLHAAKATSYMYSRDPVVRSIATLKTLKEAKLKRPAFRPFQEVVDVMKDDPGATRKRITTQVKAKVQAADNEARLAHSAGLSVQGQTVRDFHGRAADLWSTTVQSLPECVFKFALSALTDTLPHNLWKKLPSASCNLCGQQQSLLHVLNACPYALEKRRHNDRHDGILESIYIFLKKLLPPSQNVTADLPNLQYSFPQQIACTDSHPDLVVWDQSAITIIEFTVPFEFCFDAAVARKTSRYLKLLASCREAGFCSKLITIEVGSRGFINTTSFDAFHAAFPTKCTEKESLERDMVRKCLMESYRNLPPTN